MTSLRRRALVSLAASYTSQLGQTSANFLIKILLARLVLPAGWGIYAEAMMVVLVADTFTDMGLSQHVIREKHRPYGNVLLIRLILGLACTGLIILLAPLLALMFSTGQIIGPARGLAVLVLIRAVTSVPKVYLDRELMVHKALVPQLTGVLVMGAVSLPLAQVGYGVWALIIGTLVSEAAYSALLWLSVRKTIPLQWTLDHTRHLLRGSRYLFLVAVVGFVLQQGHVAITGSLLTPREVGLFAMAYTIMNMMSQMVETAIYRVIYPMFCEYASDTPKLGRIYQCATVVMLSIEAPIVFFLLFNSGFFVKLLLSDKWMPMAPVLAFLAPSGMIHKVSTFGIEVLRATKKDRWLTLVSVSSAVALTAFGVVLTKAYDLMGMVAANYIGVGTVLMIIALSKIIGRELFGMIKKMAFIYLISISIAAVPALLTGILGVTARLIAIIVVPVSWFIFYKLYWNSVAKPTLAELE